MEWLQSVWEFLSQLDQKITGLAGERPVAFYGVYAASVFAETGLVVTPFVPSETLIFAVGVVAAGDQTLNPWLGGAVALAATLLGDFCGMMLGRTVGRRWLSGRSGKFLGKKSVRWSERYFERHGAKTVLISRFVPLIRTAVPFLAGAGEMPIRTFLAFNAAGAVLWVAMFLAGGYFFGKIPFVEENLAWIVPALGVVAAVPLAIQVWHGRRERGAEG